MRQVSVFLVEDEAFIRMMIAAMLEELGHRVVAEAGTIQDAQGMAENANFDLALLDVNLGGCSVAPVAKILLRRALPFVVVTGYNSDALPQSLSKSLVLQKPFVISKLNDAIATIISG